MEEIESWINKCIYAEAAMRNRRLLMTVLSGGDSVAPTVVITCDQASPTYISPFTFTATFSEDVTGFEVGDFGIANGTKGTFTPVSAKVYTLSVVPNALAEVTATIAAGVCQDGAGNDNAEATPLAITSLVALFDQFTTDDGAPMTTPRTCEPGPGAAIITDTGNKVETLSGLLKFTGFTGAGDPGVWGGLQTLAAGLAFRVKLRSDPNDATYIVCGWDANQAAAIDDKFLYKPNTQTVGFYNAFEIGANAITSLPRATLHEFLLVHRGGTAGMLYLIKASGGAWEVGWAGNISSASNLYPAISMSNYVSSAAYADDAKVVTLGAPFNTANGLATQVLAGARSQGDIFTHTADCFLEFVVTTLPSSGQHEIQFRAQDATNYWQVTIDSSGNLDLDEVVAGTPTQRATSAGVIANGDRIVVRMVGAAINVLEGAAGHNSRITYATATNFATETDGSLLTLGPDGAISNIISLPRTISGPALAVLNAAFP